MSLEFQVYDYREIDQSIEEEEDSEIDVETEYIIQVFGRTMDGKSVYAKLTNFKPRFYIRIPDRWTKMQVDDMEKFLKSRKNTKVWYKYKNCLEKCSLIKRKKAYGFTNNKEFKFICLTFSNMLACKKFANFFEYNNKITIPGIGTRKYEIYESNLSPMLRCFHIRDIPGCGWVRANKYKLIEDEDEKQSSCDYEIVLKYDNLEPIKKDSNAPFRICSFDIECYSGDGMFPQPYRPDDKIIQIGCTYTYLGESEPYRQYICTLDTCDKIDGAVVESFDNESDLLLAWVDEIKNSGADIITGYNIFYFDEHYIYERSKKLNLEYDVCLLSKLNNYSCKFKEQKLASSALGENILRYYDTPGLIHIDLMKDVQKTYKLTSYKLDNVASHFIKGQIKEVKKLKKNKYQLKCDQINDLYLEDYIHLELMESFVSEDIGSKFKVHKLDHENNIIIVKTDIDLIEECDFSRGKVYWSQAKDDVPPKEIFRMQTQGSKERCKVAKYCLKDCRLVNLLINKLEIVTKNIEMANVCYVPFSYLFTRGQGIKLFSLCLKEYRKHKFLFPVVRKPPESELKGSYEGAIVFDPIPTVSYQAYAVKDYASLYPSSIIHKNMSHETKVTDDEFDNLEGVEYFNAQFRENDGTIEYRRFAKLKNEFGVIPTILQTVLGERKAVKKLMKVEKDPFKYKILDAKQLALKVTANSLYGQLGAATSPIRDRDIAACTTSTGREMLHLAKKYDEEILPWVINGLQKAQNKNDTETIKAIFDYQLKNPDDEKLKTKVLEYCKATNKIVFNPIIKYGDTDSIFSCYQYRENCSKVDTDEKLKLFIEIMKFGKELILPFIPEKYQKDFNKLYDKYYGKFTKTKLSDKLKTIPESNHNRVIQPIEDRMKRFLKQYMEESYFPWLWTLHDIVSQDLSYLDKNVIEDIWKIKLLGHGNSLVESWIPNTPLPLTLYIIDEVDEDEEDSEKEQKNKEFLDNINSEAKINFEKNKLIKKIKDFCKNVLKDYFLIPYLKFNVKKQKLEYYMDFRKGGKYICDKRNLDKSIELGIISGELIKSILPFPHDLEYEKTFWPYTILTKKRYVGNKYEFDRDNYKLDFMGIVLKRRDNSPIVKEICSGIINKLIKDHDPEGAYMVLENSIKKMFKGEYNIKYFLTSKSLKSKESYKDWSRIAHVVLSERIGERDPGNKPQSGDRITYAVVQVKERKGMLQGDRIETPEYIKEKGLKLDYYFYLTNQIETPALQFLKLAVPDAEQRFQRLKHKLDNERKGIIEVSNFVTYMNDLNDDEKKEVNKKITPSRKISDLMDGIISKITI